MKRKADADPAAGVLDPELAARVKNLRLVARRTVEGLLSGMHRSPHRGASVVFVEHREYRPGDDPRLLDWRAFARTDRHVIKRFEQESQLRATLALDVSGSMAFGDDRGPSKAEHAATLLAALAYVLVNQGDAVGAVTMAGELSDVVPPRSRPAHLDTVLRALARAPERGSETALGACLAAVAERVGRRAVVAVASDLLDLSPDALAPIAQLVARGNDVLVLHVLTREELTLTTRGPARFVGLEAEPAVEADAETVRAAYLREVSAFVDGCRTACVAAGARYVLAPTDHAAEQTLAMLLARRHRGVR